MHHLTKLLLTLSLICGSPLVAWGNQLMGIQSWQ
jgi:hypothetical protein